MQRTLNRELKELEIVGSEAVATCEERRSGRGLFKWGLTTLLFGIHRWHLADGEEKGGGL